MTLSQSFVLKQSVSFALIGAVALLLTAVVADVSSRTKTVDAMGKSQDPLSGAASSRACQSGGTPPAAQPARIAATVSAKRPSPIASRRLPIRLW